METLAKEKLHQSEINKDSAIAEINLILQQIATMGANDFEIPTLYGIIENIRRGVTSPEEGLEDAKRILINKQDYH